MKRSLSLTPRITLAFVLFAAVLLAGVGWLSYLSGTHSLRDATVSKLLSTAISKQAEIGSWVSDQVSDIEILAASPALRAQLEKAVNAREGSPEAVAALEAVTEELLPRVLTGTSAHQMLAVADVRSGRFIAATRGDALGASAADEPYFRDIRNGRRAAHVQYPYQSSLLKAPTMTVSAPIRDATGRVVGVLAGWMKLDGIDTIVQRRSGLYRSDDAYLVKEGGVIVSRPRFLEGAEVL